MTERTIAVFCGASSGTDEVYVESVRRCADAIAGRGFNLVYGGSRAGLMGVVADAFLARGRKVTGAIPRFLKNREHVYTNLTRLIETETMHERKEVMARLASCFLVLPGGFGTLDECFEILTWGQLQLHTKPVFLYNPEGFFTPLLQHLRHVADKGFVSEEGLGLLRVYETMADLCDAVSLVASSHGDDHLNAA